MESCLDPETLAAFAEGKLERSEIAKVIAHLRTCPECTRDVEEVRAVATPPFRLSATWLAVAASIAIALTALLVIRQRTATASDPMSRLIALVPRDSRPSQTRLASFPWAPYRGPMRAQKEVQDARRLQLVGAAGDAVAKADSDQGAAAQRTAGVALLIVGEPEGALQRLQLAAGRAPTDAGVWSDLAAADYAAAVRLDRASLLPEALAAADHAVALRRDLPEALFNRAMILERLGLPAQARQAWQRYLEVDSATAWAAEAREHLRRLPATTGDSLFRRDQPRLEQAAVAGDRAAVAALVRLYPQQTRTFAEAEYLGRWGEALQRGDAAEAGRMLAIASAIGDALAGGSGEALLSGAVQSIGLHPRELAAAQVLYRRGRIAYSRHALAESEASLRQAAALFATASDPMALVARYFAANARFDQNDVAGARRELEALRAEADRVPRYVALGAQIRWELALCLMQDDDWSGAIPILLEAEGAFRRLGERANLGFIEVLLGDAYLSVGSPDEGWAARVRAFEALSIENHGDRLPAALGAAIFVELRNGRFEAARSLLHVERGVLRDSGNDHLLTLALVREAVLNAQLGDENAAWTDVREASAVAARLSDPALRARSNADVAFAKGAVLLRRDARGARLALDDAIDGYVRSEAPPFLAECHLLRARASLAMNDRSSARRDVADGIEVYERHRISLAGSVSGTLVQDAGPELYRESIRLAGSSAKEVFDGTERFFEQIVPAAAPSSSNLSGLQSRLAGTGDMILELVVLPDEIVELAVTADDAAVVRRSRPAGDLRGLDETALYELLIRPSERQLERSSRLIVVADPLLDGIPIAALYDSVRRQRLVERLPVAMAPNAGVLHRGVRPRQRSVVTLRLTEGDEAPLPSAAHEVQEIAALYSHARELVNTTFPEFVATAAKADVLHLAGHTLKQDRTEDSVLLFGRGQRVSWRQAAAARMAGSPIVVLAACETLRGPRNTAARSLSLGGGFVAGGAGGVIGTLAPIPDDDARTIFGSVHRHLAEGRDAAEALRLAQIESINAESAGHPIAWRAVALLTTQL